MLNFITISQRKVTPLTNGALNRKNYLKRYTFTCAKCEFTSSIHELLRRVGAYYETSLSQ